ncbi:MAG: ATP-binding protein [Anaerolineales bacterium]
MTLTGVGGSGKTRLALQVAALAERAAEYPDGVWLVELATLSDPALVLPAVAATQGLREVPDRSLLDKILADALRPKTLLLILDNCEHVIQACAELAQALLRTCPNLKLLATSREALNIAGEAVLSVPPLTLPEPQPWRDPSSGQSALPMYEQSEAVRLFVARAQAASPDFTLTTENGVWVADICRRLDGIPLAIELAAARVRALSVQQIAERLDNRFSLLMGGSRTALPRHQTLAAMLDWSYDLLSDLERIVLRRLAVFQGGWTVEAAEAICAGEGIEAAEVLNVLMHLVDKSLVVVDERSGVMRYRLQETIRQYAQEKLVASGESQNIHIQFFNYYLRLAEEAEPKLKTAEQITWLPRLRADHDNFRAALDWALHRDPTRPNAALRLATALGWFWYLGGYWSEARDWLEDVLAHAEQNGPADDLLHPRTLNALAFLAVCQGAEARALAALQESQALSRKMADNQSLAFSLAYLGEILVWQDNAQQAKPVLEESIALFRGLGPSGRWGLALALKLQADAALFQEDYGRADSLFQETTNLFRQLGDRWGLGNTLESHVTVAVRQGDFLWATSLAREGLALHEEINYSFGWLHLFYRLELAIGTARTQGNLERVTALLVESLALARNVGHQWGIAASLRELAKVARAKGQPERAARLLGAAESIHEASGTPVQPHPYKAYEREVAAVRDALGAEAFRAAWTEGRTMTMEQTMAYVLGEG